MRMPVGTNEFALNMRDHATGKGRAHREADIAPTLTEPLLYATSVGTGLSRTWHSMAWQSEHRSVSGR